MNIIDLIGQYKALHLEKVIDHEKFNLIAIDHHSTRIEGSTLTEVETQVLIDEGRTPKGKPLEHSLMVRDHHAALLYTLEAAKAGHDFSVDLIREVNARVMKSTGQIYHTMLGTVDGTTGAFRKGNVSAGNTYFPNYDKVELLTSKVAQITADGMQGPLDIEHQLNLSFDVHYHLVAIHPFYDGNGRTSRLMMNFIQARYDLPLAIVRSENKAAYIEAIIQTKDSEDPEHFRTFMREEYAAMLQQEIGRYQQMQNPSKGRGFSFLF